MKIERVTRPGGGGASGVSLRSSRQAVACHPFTRSWATMPPEAQPPPGLLPPHGLSRCFFRDMCLPPPDLGPPPDAVAGRGHAAGLQETDLQGVIKTWRGNVAKKRLYFHALAKLVFDYQRVTDSPVAASRLE